jgi:heptosyltransferase-1
MKFLIVRLGSLGDVVHGIPAAAALRRAHPNAQIDWLVDPKYVELLALASGVLRPIPLDPRAGWSGLIAAVRELRRTRYDAAIDLQGLIKSAALTRAAGARLTIGLPRAHLREPLAALWYGETPDPGSDPHVIRKSLALVRVVGVPDARIEFPLDVPLTAVAAEIAGQVGPGGYALINPGAAWPNKRWPPERFGALAVALRDRLGITAVVLWGPGEEAIASAVTEAARGAAVLSPSTTLTDIASLAKGARLVISGDTGPLHVAGAVGAPLVALFGPTRTERNGPWADADITIGRYEACHCHYVRQCRIARPCIEDIQIDQVIAAAERRIGAITPMRGADPAARDGGPGRDTDVPARGGGRG